jgi:TetR/AcrR family transcriptional regulator, transcriptional repressor of bet genes
VPKIGMGPIRRDQICRAAAAVIARNGFAGTTMRIVAEEAGVSTGMLNHYFANREQLLHHALSHVAERSRSRYEQAIDGVPAGRARLEALLDSVLGPDPEALETWRVWIAASSEAVHSPSLQRTIEERLGDWFALVERALEGLVDDTAPAGTAPWAWRIDALLTGLTTLAMTSDLALDAVQIRDEVVRMVLAARPERALSG